MHSHHGRPGLGADHDVLALHAADPAAVVIGVAGLLVAVVKFLRAFAKIDDELHGRVGQQLLARMAEIQVAVEPQVLDKVRERRPRNSQAIDHRSVSLARPCSEGGSQLTRLNGYSTSTWLS